MEKHYILTIIFEDGRRDTQWTWSMDNAKNYARSLEGILYYYIETIG